VVLVLYRDFLSDDDAARLPDGRIRLLLRDPERLLSRPGASVP